MVHMQNICDEIEAYAKVGFETFEQHVDARSSRIDRDKHDSTKILNCLLIHHPFPQSECLMSISSGLVGGADVNYHLAQEEGIKGVKRIVGDNFQSVKFKRKDKVVNLASVPSTFNFGNIKVKAVDPLTLFQRICLMKQSDEDLKDLLIYELAPYPMLLFTEEGMRKGTKSLFYKEFIPLNNVELIGKDKFFVVDGGYLLHKVTWPRSVSFKCIAQSYISYLQRNFGSQLAVVFDGYPSEGQRSGTKSAERYRRSMMHSSDEVVVEAKIICLVPQEKFLSNDRNKSNLIALLKTEFQNANIEVNQAEEDADVMIVNAAISKTQFFESVIIIGEDVDLLIIMTGLGQHLDNLYFQKPGRGKDEALCFSPTSYKYDNSSVLFLHAISGCDTTSALFGQGKKKFAILLKKYDQLQETVSVYLKQEATPEEVMIAGERFLVALYSGSLSGVKLNTLRYDIFARNFTKTKVTLSCLPPTQDAAF